MSNTEKKNAVQAVHWADQCAQKIIRERGDLDSYTCASGITPSGTVHIGNFREIISVDLVVRALRRLGKKVRFIYSWDDYDVFRKVPENMPDKKTLEAHLRFPITMVPDTTGRDASYARHHEVDVEQVLPLVGIEPEFLYQVERYRSGMYAEGMKTALQNREKIKDCLNRYRDDAHKIPENEEYWPAAAFCCKCNKDTTEILSYDGEYGVEYRCTSCGHSEKADLRSSKELKLGWRVDWPMRWQFEKTVFEPAGKDHHSQGGSFDTARLVSQEIYNWPAPVSFRYDFIGIKGLPGKMSSSKGKVISLDDVLRVYQPEIARYLFAGTRPNTEFSISFDLDVIKTYEDYDKTERIAWGVDKAKNDEVFEKAGAIRATTWQEFLDVSLALGLQPPLQGDNIVMITNGGGSGLLSCDHFERCGLPLHELSEISPGLAGRIRAYMPMFGSPLNPVDISGTASPIQYKGAFHQAIRDPKVHGILGSICPTAVTDVGAVVDIVIELHEMYKHLNKPFIMECQGGEECQEAIMKLRDHGIPAYPTAEQSVNAMIALYKYGQIKKSK